jgi:hypothetical protein
MPAQSAQAATVKVSAQTRDAQRLRIPANSQEFGDGSRPVFGSSGRTRTYNPSVNNRSPRFQNWCYGCFCSTSTGGGPSGRTPAEVRRLLEWKQQFGSKCCASTPPRSVGFWGGTAGIVPTRCRGSLVGDYHRWRMRSSGGNSKTNSLS